MLNFEAGKVIYVELSLRDEHLDVRYKGVSAFHTPAEELVAIITGELPTGEPDEFTEAELDLRLWRPVVPSDYEPEDPDDEYRKGAYWQTIGAGTNHS